MAEPTSAPGPSGVETLETPRGGGEARKPGATGLLRDPRFVWAVAVIAVLAAAFSTFQWQVQAAEARAREEVREAAEVVAARVTTFEGAAIDEFVEELRALATDDYAAQVGELFSGEFRDALRDNEVESVGEVTRSFVQQLDGDEAEVFVLVRQTSLNASVEEPIVDELRMELTLVREAGRWLVADIAVLGPSPTLAPGAPGAPGEPAAPQGGQG
ncbi:MAG TPA: hypothetical protein VM324_11465 [Egibacteraceae bacterium]|jgi:hypothetical protein|nr:hypothetical protein [Egibacteraceae bacterium]